MDYKSSAEFKQITEELYKKNLDLVNANKEMKLLQELYEIMMTTYDVEKVAQQSIEAVVKDLGFLSGLVTLKIPKEEYLYFAAITQLKAGLTLLKLGTPANKLKIPLDNKENLLSRVFQTREEEVTNDVSSILRPLTATNGYVKRIVESKVRSIITYPIVFGENTLGVFAVFLAANPEKIPISEKQILKRISTVFGIAIYSRMLYQKLQQANKKLEELDKRKDEFLSVAAHELRAPMTAIKGNLSMILEGDAGEVPAKVNEFLEDAVEGNDRLIRLVNNMLNVSRIEEGRLTYEMGVVSLAKVVDDVYDDFISEAEEKGLEISLKIPKGLKDQVYVDKDRIHEVIANLISNAIKYTDKGKVTILLMNKNGKIRLEVQDTGLGIKLEDQQRLFRKFTRVESSAGKKIGTGLGLYISKLLIEKFGGEISFESQIGKGSTFWFELPVRSNH